MTKAVVIKTAGDPQIAGAIVEGINGARLAAVKAEYARLQARNGVRCEGDDRRWQRTRRRLARKYATVPVGRVHGAILGVWALLWYEIAEAAKYLDAWNRGERI